MGIPIGWPNASSANQGQMVYYQIQQVCGGAVPPNSTTQLVDNSIYQTGDYVDSGGNRVLLGAIAEEEGIMVFNIGLPIYTSCPT